MKRSLPALWLASLGLLLLASLPVALARQQAPRDATSRYAPDIEARLLQNGYYANIIQAGDRRGLQASQVKYPDSIWLRDIAYATSGYGYVLADMSVLREAIELFLARVEPDGSVAEVIFLREGRLDAQNRRTWDSMPDLIHAVSAYVARTGDLAFYRQHRETLQRVGMWLVSRDTDGDGLPDQNDNPYGYYDSVRNSVRHTYAIARFYSAYRDLAALERAASQDGSAWEERARLLRAAFQRPASAGGYWLPERDWPLAWWYDDGTPLDKLETFGVFAALHSGLIGPQDGERHARLMEALHLLLPELIAGPTPMRLMAGGYPAALRREVDPPVPLWMLDTSAPWISGMAAPAYAAAGYTDNAEAVMQAYMAMAGAHSPPVLEFAAADEACYGPGSSRDGGRTWDNAAWFQAVYGGHYGITMTPETLIVQPRPFADRDGDGINNLRYQGATVQLSLDIASLTYRLRVSQAVPATLRPMLNARQLRVNDGPPAAEARLTLEPGQEYVIRSQGIQPAPPRPAIQPPAGGFYNCAAFREVWSRADLPVAEEPPGLQARAWLWGPQPLTGGRREPYAEGIDGRRLVQYYAKGRMEINNPDAPGTPGYVTSGRLVVELISGRLQVGNDSYVNRNAADQVIAGDPAAVNPAAPTYRTFFNLDKWLGNERASDRRGELVTAQLAREGFVTEVPALADYNVRIAAYEPATGYNIPDVFTRFFNQQGLVYENGQFQRGQILDPLFVVGLPISEPYWARVRVAGQEQDVLIQPFERRVLTYTPANPPAWRVEMGNVGQHYLQWRYGP